MRTTTWALPQRGGGSPPAARGAAWMAPQAPPPTGRAAAWWGGTTTDGPGWTSLRGRRTPPAARHAWVGRLLEDERGARVGRVRDVFPAVRGEAHGWALVRTGRLRLHRTLVPLVCAHDDGLRLRGRVRAAAARRAARFAGAGAPSARERRALRAHYGLCAVAAHGSVPLPAG